MYISIEDTIFNVWSLPSLVTSINKCAVVSSERLSWLVWGNHYDRFYLLKMAIMEQCFRMRKTDEIPTKYNEPDKGVKNPNCCKRASTLGEWPPPICNLPVTRRVRGAQTGQWAHWKRQENLLTDVIFSLNRRDLGRSPLCFWDSTLTAFPKTGLIKTQVNFEEGNKKTWKTRVQKALRRVRTLQDWIKEKKALPDVSKLIKITFSLGILQRYSSSLSMIYCSENTLKTSIVSFPYLHSTMGPSWVLPLYKHLMTLYCGWKHFLQWIAKLKWPT